MTASLWPILKFCVAPTVVGIVMAFIFAGQDMRRHGNGKRNQWERR